MAMMLPFLGLGLSGQTQGSSVAQHSCANRLSSLHRRFLKGSGLLKSPFFFFFWLLA